ncbi:DNA-binding domain-containing protein [Shewanella submarina]|uniref:DNA-binding domain-containing protein n=1 Tax=Shewanella submarina TaxID=2016376 RepID=A0ABV7G9T9_9GAMM|nr:DNA-binding domain-containing protein [Shewanella submarina]MCL1039314.1 DNA-binding domain-containing protein [Shewanella submarina]
MPGLKHTQNTVMQYLLQPDEEARASLAELVVAQGNVSLETRMGIYANAYRIRLKEVIETDHEQLCFYLGDELFERMADEFIAASPSQNRSLRGFCEPLPEFLAEDEFFSQYPILADIARFERRLLTAFDAADTSREEFAALAALPPEQWPAVCLRFHPSVQLFRCASNAVETWQALKQGQEVPGADYSGWRYWLIWRGRSRLTEFISLQPWQLVLVEAVIAGENFAGLCELMLDFFDESQAPAQVFESLKAWFEMGLIRSLVVSD